VERELVSTDLPNNYDWWDIGHAGGEFKGDYSLRSHFAEEQWPPVIGLGEIDWPAQVNDVGLGMDGTLVASTLVNAAAIELGQTIRMFKDPFGLLSGRLLTGRKTARQLSKDGANVWLENRYGWQNFIRDVGNVAGAVSKAMRHINYLQSQIGRWTPVRSRRQDVFTLSVPHPSIGFGGYPVYVSTECKGLRIQRTSTFSLQLKRDESFRILSPIAYVMQALGVTDVYATLWEVLPFSFVVDWFFNVSKWAANTTIYKVMQHQVRNCCYSVDCEWRGDFELFSTAFDNHGNSKSEISLQNDVLVRKTYERELGFPPDSYTSGFFGGFTITHLADSAALIAQRL